MVVCIDQVISSSLWCITEKNECKKMIIIIWTSINFIDYIPLAILWNNVNEDTKKRLLFLGKIKDYFHKLKALRVEITTYFYIYI